MTSRERLRKLARSLAPFQPRRALLALGRHMGPSALTSAANSVGALEQGRWLAAAGTAVPNLADRFAVFEEALRHAGDRSVLYLEFGVYRGRTLRWWSAHLPGDASRLVGFDSFEGLPEEWQPDAPQGTFAAGGPPEIPDPRVSLVVGWFEDTLPTWEPPPHDQLIVNIDCDLYSSTRTVLEWLTNRLDPGALVYFDDLFNRDHQWRALREWLADEGAAARPIAMARWGHHLLFEIRPSTRRWPATDVTGHLDREIPAASYSPGGSPPKYHRR